MNRAGMDVSNEVFDVALREGSTCLHRTYPNTDAGRRRAIKWLTLKGRRARVCLEATGIYHLQLAIALDRAPRIEVMVANPRAVKRSIEAHMVRAKTDATDAEGVLKYLETMPFRAWVAPDEAILQIQAAAHRIAQLTKERTRERSRRHAAFKAGPHTRSVVKDIDAHIDEIEHRIECLKDEAVVLAQAHSRLGLDFEIIDSAPGFAALSVIKVLGEIAHLPDDLGPKKWVAQAGLDPRPFESGSSICPPRHISKQGNARLRAALYMPALVAIQKDPNVKAFYNALLARGKAKMQAVIAVMRKLLHAIWGMLHHRQFWDGDKFFQIPKSLEG